MEEYLPLKIAKNTCAYVNKTLSLGPANGLLNAGKAVFLEYFGKKAEEEAARDAARKLYPQEKDAQGNLKLTFHMFPQIERSCKAAKTGNCGEFALVAFQHLRMVYGWGSDENSLEMLKAKNHWVVVLNRNKETSLSSPKSWNEDAVICDSWRDKARMLTSYWESYSDFKPLESLRLPDDYPNKYLLVPPDWKSW